MRVRDWTIQQLDSGNWIATCGDLESPIACRKSWVRKWVSAYAIPAKTLEQMAEEYAENCDNESGGFLTHQLEEIRCKAYLAGAKAALSLPEVRAMKKALKFYASAWMDRSECAKALAAFDRLLEGVE